MSRPLRALIVEDVEADALLAVRELKRGGFDVTFARVETPEAMSATLATQQWDIVISDYSMPRFNAPMALALVKEHKLDLPFIIVSGTVGEDTAVEAIHAGANDFLVKGRLARLVSAVEREMRLVGLRAERVKMQEQLLISDRMASVGTLAAGVAHEINNPLATLMANLTFAAEDISRLILDVRTRGADAAKADGAPAPTQGPDWVVTRLLEIEEPLRDAHESADRVRHIVRDLKMFSRADEEKTGPVDVRRVLEFSLRMACNEIRHRARLVKEYGNVPFVEGNEGRLGQVFLNLIVNAAQAMPEGRADRNEIRIVTEQDDQGRVVVLVRDTGTGIAPAVVSRIFEPFFTTKPIGDGTGLGLALCRRIVTALGGELTVESEVGKGTTFRTVLPVATSDVVDVPSGPTVLAVGPRGRILVVDDEPMLGTAVRRMLGAEHEVTVLPEAREALRRISGGDRFDVILCDLMMPQMTGMDLHGHIFQVAPQQAARMVFMTGGPFTSRAREFLDQVRNPRIEKPFDVSGLRALVHRMLL
jgi:signal transduction histidine kinase